MNRSLFAIFGSIIGYGGSPFPYRNCLIASVLLNIILILYIVYV